MSQSDLISFGCYLILAPTLPYPRIVEAGSKEEPETLKEIM
jgi:hypothetical protein